MTPGYECPRTRVLRSGVDIYLAVGSPEASQRSLPSVRDKVGYEILRTTEIFNRHRFNRNLVASVQFS
jgi:hypothetical protein